MESFDWFGVPFGILGLLYLLSGCYEWTWWQRWNRGDFFAAWFGRENTSLIFVGCGIGMLAVGVGLTLNTLFHTDVLGFIIGIVLSTVIGTSLYNTSHNQPLWEAFSSAIKRKKKKET